MAKAKKPGTALVNWEAEFKNLAKEDAKDIEVGQGKYLSLKGGILSFGGAKIPDNELSCVLLGWTRVNAYYDPDIAYNPENPSSPICYAFGRKEKEMAPHEAAPDKQESGCAGCPLNEFGSGQNGKSKACKNSIRLALIAATDLEDLSAAEVVYLNVPPTSMKNVLFYLKNELGGKQERPFWSVVTTVKPVPDAKNQFSVTFACEELIEDTDLFPELKEMAEAATAGLEAPFPVKEKEPEPVKGKGGKSSKFARR